MGNEVKINRKETASFQYEEAIKTLRTNIQFSGSSVKAVTITSSIPHEGKSEITSRLAESTALIGKKVLLVDADIRKSMLVERLQIEKEVDGLSQYLSGQKDLEDVVYHTNIEGLDIIFSGPFAPNSSELLEEAAFDKLLAWGREHYDYIFIDTPPINNVIDGAIIAKKCDGAVLVIASGRVSYKVVQRVKQQLEKSGCRILGAVLSQVNVDKGNYYYNKYGSYSKAYQK